jgi:hypothetical protein
MNRIRWFVLLSLVLVLAPAAAFGQTRGTIGGRVTQVDTGAPVVAALVSVDGTNLRAVTNENGDYVIANVSPGTYTVRASRIGLTAASDGQPGAGALGGQARGHHRHGDGTGAAHP